MKCFLSRVVAITSFWLTFSVVSASAEKVIYKTISLIDPASIGWNLEGMNEVAGFAIATMFTGEATITDIGGGKYKLVVTMGKDPTIKNTLKSPQIVNAQTIRFVTESQNNETVTITPEKISIGKGVNVSTGSKDAFNGLINYLKTRTGSPSSGNSQSSGQSTQGLPSSGNLSPATFVTHPFGFLPTSTGSLTEALSLLKKAGWKAELNNGTSSLISIISSTPFKIPFKMYGKDISVMSAWGKNPTKIKSYDLEVSDFKTNWTQEDATRFAKKAVDELLAKGYEKTDDNTLYGYDFYVCTLKGNGLEIKVKATQSSKYASLDSFGVWINVWKI